MSKSPVQVVHCSGSIHRYWRRSAWRNRGTRQTTRSVNNTERMEKLPRGAVVGNYRVVGRMVQWVGRMGKVLPFPLIWHFLLDFLALRALVLTFEWISFPFQ